jgi:uncharacterized protein YjfI (DUF2170 family)
MLKWQIDLNDFLQASAELATNIAYSCDEGAQRHLCKALNENGDLQIRVSTRTRRVVVAMVNGDQERILFDKSLEQEVAV